MMFETYLNAEIILYKFLKNLYLNIGYDVISSEIEKHPDYPSLLSISDVLKTFRVENEALRLDFENLDDLPCPFLAHTRIKGGNLLIVHDISEDEVLISDEKSNYKKIRKTLFKEVYSGVVLAAETPQREKTQGKQILTFVNSLKMPFLMICCSILFLMALFFHTTYFKELTVVISLLTLIKTIGLLTTILLLTQSVGSNNALLQKICQGGDKISCSDILSSSAAEVFKGLSWSEVGFFYFSGTWLAIFNSGNTFVWYSLIVLNLVSLPYTFYSIYYQGFVAKKWCPLCCTVQALLWSEAILMNSASTRRLSPIYWVDVNTIISLSIPVVLWLILKPFIIKQQQFSAIKGQLWDLKYNTNLFNIMLKDQPKYTIPGKDWSVVIGNVNATNTIVMVSNPYCAPCGKTHQQLHNLLMSNSNLQARIVFVAKNVEGDLLTPICRHLMGLSGLPDKSIVSEAMHNWYSQRKKDFDSWSKGFPVFIGNDINDKLDEQKAWCDVAEVISTPMFMLNGYTLPDLYQLDDLKYLLV